MDMHRYWNDPGHGACPVIAAFLEAWAESMPDDQSRHWLQPLAPVVRDSRSSAASQAARRMLAMDWLVRDYAPIWLDADGRSKLAEHARSLRNLPALSLGDDPFDLRMRSGLGPICAAAGVLPDAYSEKTSRAGDNTLNAVAGEQASMLGVAVSHAVKPTAQGDSAGSAAVAAIATDPVLAEEWDVLFSIALSIASGSMHGRILLAVHEGLVPRVEAMVVPALERAGIAFSQAQTEFQFEKAWRKARQVAEKTVDADPDIYDEAWRIGWEAIGGTIEDTQSSAFNLLLRMTERR
ncbi:hypothetical protein [Lysobacter capsici]|uniref:hypothetical protein n=1 Tax=Lysobacter capsici TaxID=435897 RepID=UPI000A72DD31|nr:hypothetical protein [Lysobacter capsici]